MSRSEWARQLQEESIEYLAEEDPQAAARARAELHAWEEAEQARVDWAAQDREIAKVVNEAGPIDDIDDDVWAAQSAAAAAMARLRAERERFERWADNARRHDDLTREAAEREAAATGLEAER